MASRGARVLPRVHALTYLRAAVTFSLFLSLSLFARALCVCVCVRSLSCARACTLVQSSGRNRAAVDATHASAATESTLLVHRPEHRHRVHPRRCGGGNSIGSSSSSSIGNRSSSNGGNRHDGLAGRHGVDRRVHHEHEHLDFRDEPEPRFLVQRDELLLYLRDAGLLRRLRSLEQSRYETAASARPLRSSSVHPRELAPMPFDAVDQPFASSRQHRSRRDDVLGKSSSECPLEEVCAARRAKPT